MDAYILQTCDRDIAKAKYNIAMKMVDYEAKEHNNNKIREEWANVQVVNRKEAILKRNDYELEIIGIQKKMLELDLELLEDKKNTLISRLPPPHRPAEPPQEHSGE